jgi:hypothetical protein
MIKQCSALTKQNNRCKNHVTDSGEFCERHNKKNISPNANIVININNQCPVIEENFSIPANIFVNGKFVPNVNKVKIPLFKMPQRGGPRPFC